MTLRADWRLVRDYFNIVSRNGPDSDKAREFRNRYADFPKFQNVADALDNLKRTLDNARSDHAPAETEAQG